MLKEFSKLFDVSARWGRKNVTLLGVKSTDNNHFLVNGSVSCCGFCPEYRAWRWAIVCGYFLPDHCYNEDDLLRDEAEYEAELIERAMSRTNQVKKRSAL